MRLQLLAVAVISSALLAGCGDRGTGNPPTEQNGQPGTAPSASASDAGSGAGTPASAGEAPAASSSTSTRAPESAPRAVTPSTASPTATQSAPQAPEARLPQFREVTVPAGTALPLELMTTLSSGTSKVESPVRARLRHAVLIDGATALPAGAVLSGTVTDVSEAGRVRGRSHLTIRFNEVRLDSSTEKLSTAPLTYQGEATKSEDATKIGAGAGIGAAIGGILGGGKGAAKGAAIGGAAGTGAVLATKGREVHLAAGSDIAATLASPFTVRVPAR